ncbi:hypothetical protein BEH_07235 [Priestia filamentosa]|uniref:Uncharacterized protein n=1 Tax=Priestia filamentosa TaxID=1402861 RepID=A0A0H4KCS5_9BACI|nr:hypothetical protein [Priestia filamentosa]AKO91912.1 hypothetical protein BEH_07235 [Priestia filamentosa]
MTNYKVKHNGAEMDLYTYCSLLSKKNNSTLYTLEKYIGSPLLSDDTLMKIRDDILTVSAEISRLHEKLIMSDTDEGL